MKKILFTLVFSFVLAWSPTWAVEPVPEGINFLYFLNNLGTLPLYDLVIKNPLIPSGPREIAENFMKASGFNFFSDISGIQIMLKIEGRKPEGVVIFKGKFDIDKLTAMLKLVGGESFEQTNVGSFTMFSNEKQKIPGVCFPDNQTLVVGNSPFVQAALECRIGQKSSAAFAPLMSKISDKAYATLIFTGKEVFTKLISKVKAKVARKAKGPLQEFFPAFLDQIAGNIELNYVVATRTDDQGEVWINYNRENSRDLSFHLLMATTDQAIFMSNFLKTLAQSLSQFKPVPEENKQVAQ